MFYLYAKMHVEYMVYIISFNAPFRVFGGLGLNYYCMVRYTLKKLIFHPFQLVTNGRFEPASTNALKLACPLMEVKVCFFHLCEIVYRKVPALGPQ